MRVDDLDSQIKNALSSRSKLPADLEQALFSQAEELLSKRRERLEARGASLRETRNAKQRRRFAVRKLKSRVIELFALHPDKPATAAVFAALVLTFVAIQTRHDSSAQASFSDLPALPKFNDVPARYDALLLAERQAYEREVEDAHKESSGGL